MARRSILSKQQEQLQVQVLGSDHGRIASDDIGHQGSRIAMLWVRKGKIRTKLQAFDGVHTTSVLYPAHLDRISHSA